MQRLIVLVIALQSLHVSILGAQITNRVVTDAVTGVVASVSQSLGTNGVLATGGDFVNALYLYVADNGKVGLGLGNTINNIQHGALKPVTTESVDLPPMIPSNSVLDLNLEIVTSQFYAEKTHVGMGAAIYTLWKIGWLKKIHWIPFQYLDGIQLGIGASPDVDKSVNLIFESGATVAFGKAALQWTF